MDTEHVLVDNEGEQTRHCAVKHGAVELWCSTSGPKVTTNDILISIPNLGLWGVPDSFGRVTKSYHLK